MSGPASGEVLAVGLMSGTSADAVDAALVTLSGTDARTVRCRLVAFLEMPLPAPLRERVRQAQAGVPLETAAVARLHVALGEAFASATVEVCSRAGVDPGELAFVASHGQTVAHVPSGPGERATLQLGCPAVIAERTGATVVHGFRDRDVAAGGLGAPLMPGAERALLQDATHGADVVLQNLGGIGNVTALGGGRCRAFDTGPANMVLDLLCRRAGAGDFDAGGRLARRGHVLPATLRRALSEPFFRATPPRTGGHEQFGAEFVERFVAHAWAECGGAEPPLQDLLATATELTAVSVADSVRQHVFGAGFTPLRGYLSGGGARNTFLCERIAARCPELAWSTVAELGIQPDAKEAIGFAVLGLLTLLGKPSSVPEVTGASRAVVCGSVVPGRRGLFPLPTATRMVRVAASADAVRPTPAFKHSHTVRYGECDMQGVVYNPRYLDFVDVAVDSWHRARLGRDFEQSVGYDSMVKAASVTYESPARFQDVLVLGVFPTKWGRTSYNVRVEGHVQERSIFVAEMVYVSVLPGASPPKPVEISRAVRERLGASTPAPRL